MRLYFHGENEINEKFFTGFFQAFRVVFLTTAILQNTS